jgi:hypothetical protein
MVHTTRRSFIKFNSVLPTPIPPPTLITHCVQPTVLRIHTKRHRLQKNSLPCPGVPHRALPSVRTFMSAANEHQTHAPSDMVVCSQHTKSTTTPPPSLTINPPLTPNVDNPILITMSSNSNLPTPYKQALLRDRPAPAFTDERYNPRSRLAGHPLAPCITAPQIPTT